MLCYGSHMSEIKGDVEDAGESMKRGAKKTGNRMEEGAEEAKDKVDQLSFPVSNIFCYIQANYCSKKSKQSK